MSQAAAHGADLGRLRLEPGRWCTVTHIDANVCACIVPIIASGTSNIGFLIRCDCVVRGHLNTACHCFEVAGLEPDFWVRTPLPKLYW